MTKEQYEQKIAAENQRYNELKKKVWDEHFGRLRKIEISYQKSQQKKSSVKLGDIVTISHKRYKVTSWGIINYLNRESLTFTGRPVKKDGSISYAKNSLHIFTLQDIEAINEKPYKYLSKKDNKPTGNNE